MILLFNINRSDKDQKAKSGFKPSWGGGGGTQQTRHIMPITFQEGQPEKTVKYCYEGVWKAEVKSVFGLLNQQQQMPLKMYWNHYVYTNAKSSDTYH